VLGVTSLAFLSPIARYICDAVDEVSIAEDLHQFRTRRGVFMARAFRRRGSLD
jgi:hypothetical protein